VFYLETDSIKSISDIESIVDQNISDLKIYGYDRNNVILFLCQLFERRVKKLKKINGVLREIIPLELSDYRLNVSVTTNEKILDEHEALSLLIREVIKRDESQVQLDSLDFETINKIGNEAFEKAIEQIKAESLYPSMYRGLFSGTVISSKKGEECILFSYKNEQIAFYEAVNGQIINDYNLDKRLKYKSPEELGIKKFTPWTFINIRYNAKEWMDIDFNFPNDYRIGKYKIREIKEVWSYVITKAYIEYYSNLGKGYPTLMELNYKDIKYKYASKEIAENLINDLTYRGDKNKKNSNGKFIYSTLLTEPILEIEGKKLIVPSLILNYQASRNIISTLNRIYEGDQQYDSSIDADRKESIFINDLKESLLAYPNLISSSGINIVIPVKTDVDFIIYDINTKTLVCFELKWLNEPVTAVEILNKDKELEKGISVQLPNYELGIHHNIEEFMTKAFQNNYEVSEVHNFVLTKGTIGSGNINRGKYHIINQRMLEKALHNSSGNLLITVDLLKRNELLPKLDKHFKLVSDIKLNVGNVSILTDGYSIIEPYSLNLIER
jgi:hypothetical protein